jgi:hypothetical protein
VIAADQRGLTVAAKAAAVACAFDFGGRDVDADVTFDLDLSLAKRAPPVGVASTPLMLAR